MRRRRVLATLSVIAGTSGCLRGTTDKPTTRTENPRQPESTTATSTATTTERSVSLTASWTAPVSVTDATIHGETLYAASSSGPEQQGGVFAVDTTSGAVDWGGAVGQNVRLTRVRLVDKTVFASGERGPNWERGRLVALDPQTGERTGTRDLPVASTTRPAVTGEYVAVGGWRSDGDPNLHLLTRDDLSVEWASTWNTKNVVTGVTVLDDVVLAGYSNRVAAHSLTDGTVVWQKDWNGSAFTRVDDDLLFHVHGILTRFDPVERKIIWQSSMDRTLTEPLVLDETAYVGAEDGLYAFDLDGGERRWFVRSTDSVQNQPTAVGDLIVFVDETGTLRAVDPHSGRVVHETEIDPFTGWFGSTENRLLFGDERLRSYEVST